MTGPVDGHRQLESARLDAECLAARTSGFHEDKRPESQNTPVAPGLTRGPAPSWRLAQRRNGGLIARCVWYEATTSLVKQRMTAGVVTYQLGGRVRSVYSLSKKIAWQADFYAYAEAVIRKKVANWLGLPGLVIMGMLVFGIGGLIGAILTSSIAAIPIVGLLALLFEPFPTVVLYSAAALLAYVWVRTILAFLPIGQRLLQWLAAISAVVLITALGYFLPESWNASAGLVPPVPQSQPQAVDIPNGGAIAFIDHGEAQYVRCDAICLSLLMQGRVKFVEVAATLRQPSLFEALPGKRFMINAKTRDCLKGKRDYAFTENEVDRHEEFLGGLPIEYDTCLDSENVTVRPELQTTIVEWIEVGNGENDPKPGFSGVVSIIRTIIPQRGRKPQVHEARYRAGYRYIRPLYISSYAGNAASGSYFSPAVAISYFTEPGFPDTLEPRFWRFLKGSDEVGAKTASWLDGVVERHSPDRQ